MTTIDTTPAAKPKASRPKGKRKPRIQKAPTASRVASTGPGRPGRYSDELAERICDELASGKTLRAVCRENPDFPDERTVRGWARDPAHPFCSRYEAARLVGYASMFDQMLEIADDCKDDIVETVNGKGETVRRIDEKSVHRAKLRVETRRHYLSISLPRLYQSRHMSEVEHSGKEGQPIQVESSIGPVDRIDLARRLFHLLGEAVAQRKAPVINAAEALVDKS